MNITETASGYDNTGAMIYIIIVLLWYSIGIILMLGMQMRARAELIEEATRRRTKHLIRNLRDQTHTKEILEELVDKEKRARLWDIYLDGKTRKTEQKLSHAETLRIRHIEKQLENINRTHRMTNEIEYNRSRSDTRQLTSSHLSEDQIESSKLRRRSSFDQQTLERWKWNANQAKTQEQIPWATKKLIIRRYFRRQPKKSSPLVSQTSTTSDNLATFTQDITTLTRRPSGESLNESSSVHQRENPYLTYFCSPTNVRPNIFDSAFFAAPEKN